MIVVIPPILIALFAIYIAIIFPPILLLYGLVFIFMVVAEGLKEDANRPKEDTDSSLYPWYSKRGLWGLGRHTIVATSGTVAFCFGFSGVAGLVSAIAPTYATGLSGEDRLIIALASILSLVFSYLFWKLAKKNHRAYVRERKYYVEEAKKKNYEN